ncbi:MAG: hypothetical protein KA197_04465, partial [Aquabacterium sp.]|nr:hypothetical protein [Aquabacterium sp.]
GLHHGMAVRCRYLGMSGSTRDEWGANKPTTPGKPGVACIVKSEIVLQNSGLRAKKAGHPV